MLNSNPMRYTRDDVLEVVLSIQEYLNSDPFLFQVPGIFRESGALEKSKRIVNDILDNLKYVKRSHTVHDYIGAMKLVLNQYSPEIQDDTLNGFKERIKACEDHEGAVVLMDFIDSLISSNDENKFALGQILYTYLNLATNASLCSARNKMDAKNLGIIVGPLFANMMGSPQELALLILKFNRVCEKVIAEELCRVHFDERYGAFIPDMQQKMLDTLEREKEVLNRLREKYGQKILELELKNSELQERIAVNRKNNKLADKRTNKTLQYAIAQNKAQIKIFKKDDRDDTLKKLEKIDRRINKLHDAIGHAKPKKSLLFSLGRRKSAAEYMTLPAEGLDQIVQRRAQNWKI